MCGAQLVQAQGRGSRHSAAFMRTCLSFGVVLLAVAEREPGNMCSGEILVSFKRPRELLRADSWVSWWQSLVDGCSVHRSYPQLPYSKIQRRIQTLVIPHPNYASAIFHSRKDMLLIIRHITSCNLTALIIVRPQPVNSQFCSPPRQPHPRRAPLDISPF